MTARGCEPAKLVSGGQTGVDRAALDVAQVLGIECGGWCPKDRAAEDGRVPDRYPLQETPSDDPAQRTEWNVRDSDATLVLTCGPPSGGTALTLERAERLGRPCRSVDLAGDASLAGVRDWLRRTSPQVLNVAGPRASEAPEAYALARALLERLLGSEA